MRGPDEHELKGRASGSTLCWTENRTDHQMGHRVAGSRDAPGADVVGPQIEQ